MLHDHRDMRWREAVTALAVLGLRTSPASSARGAQAVALRRTHQGDGRRQYV